MTAVIASIGIFLSTAWSVEFLPSVRSVFSLLSVEYVYKNRTWTLNQYTVNHYKYNQCMDTSPITNFFAICMHILHVNWNWTLLYQIHMHLLHQHWSIYIHQHTFKLHSCLLVFSNTLNGSFSNDTLEKSKHACGRATTWIVVYMYIPVSTPIKGNVLNCSILLILDLCAVLVATTWT